MRNLPSGELYHALYALDGNWVERRDYVMEHDLDLRGFVTHIFDDLTRYYWLDSLMERILPASEYEAYMAERKHIFELKKQADDAHWDAYWNKLLINRAEHDKLILDTHRLYWGLWRAYVNSLITE